MLAECEGLRISRCSLHSYEWLHLRIGALADRGHAGEWGYLYADRGVQMSRGQSMEGPGREWTLDCDLGDGWWRVSYRLD